jgi:hypothetical protein
MRRVGGTPLTAAEGGCRIRSGTVTRPQDTKCVANWASGFGNGELKATSRSGTHTSPDATTPDQMIMHVDWGGHYPEEQQRTDEGHREGCSPADRVFGGDAVAATGHAMSYPAGRKASGRPCSLHQIDGSFSTVAVMGRPGR